MNDAEQVIVDDCVETFHPPDRELIEDFAFVRNRVGRMALIRRDEKEAVGGGLASDRVRSWPSAVSPPGQGTRCGARGLGPCFRESRPLGM